MRESKCSECGKPLTANDDHKHYCNECYYDSVTCEDCEGIGENENGIKCSKCDGEGSY